MNYPNKTLKNTLKPILIFKNVNVKMVEHFPKNATINTVTQNTKK